jgi:hypothetical protein
MRRAVWLAALGLAAAPAPAALAADGLDPLPPIPDAGELAATIAEEAGMPEPALLPEIAPLPALPAAPAQAAAEEPAQTGADAAPPPAPVATAPQAVPAVSEPQPAAEPAPDAPPPPAVQAEAANVNVSVRIDSPGDDGAVAQVNVATSVELPQYQPEQPRYQPVVAPNPPPEAEEPRSEATQVEEPEPAAPEGAQWTWEWGCGGDPFGDVSLPAGVTPQVWIWNWDWNCGADETPATNNQSEITTGYQPAPTQYRPVNVNVSIRVNSAGDNGPVAQANVAVGVRVPPPLVIAPAPPSATPAEAVASAFATTVELLLAPVQAAPPAPEVSAPAAAPAAASGDEGDDCCRLGEPRGVAYPAERPVSVVLARPEARRDPDITLEGADAVVMTARLELRARRVLTPAATPQRPQARPARSVQPRRLPGDEGAAAATQQSGLGLAPVGAPDRSLPLAALVLLAFAFASGNSSWAAVRSRPTPGADPDEPPDRPG